MEERAGVVADAARDEEERNEDAEARGLELPPNSPSKTSLTPTLLDSPEKKIVSSTIVATSAIEEPAITSCPNGDSIAFASLSTAITIPKPVAESMIAIKQRGAHEARGIEREADHERESERGEKADAGDLEQPPAQPLVVDLEPRDQGAGTRGRSGT